MVIRHGKVDEATCSRLFNQRQWLKAPIAALGMTVKIADIRAAVWTDLLEDRPKGMRISRHRTGLSFDALQHRSVLEDLFYHQDKRMDDQSILNAGSISA